ncbi:helix-turn-helix domain-containing protein [Paenibacillus hamazuiensis]|uniref:helix-turn-helix domain-containing protein n=1 Tax=Paenibacillus hamazuiensis TaxID=2936508 RepID=UPI00200BB175|nr:AraC family transcriptional regulator [Paenibacillus hamazuiensis]
MSVKPPEPFRHAYGFRFRETPSFGVAQIDGIGWEQTVSADYNWDGMNRGNPDSVLFQYTLSGRGMMLLGDQTHTLDAGKAFLVRIPSVHRYFFPEDGGHWEFLWIMLKGDRLAPVFEELASKTGQVAEFAPESPPIRALKAIFEKAKLRQITDGYLNSMYAYQFISELYRSSAYEETASTLPEAIRKSVRYIELNYERIGSLDEMADVAGLSKFHFLRQFRRFTGLTPLEYLNKLRIEKAAGLLRTTELTLDEIAASVGFAGGNYFSKVFRHWVGLSPGKFRSEQELAPEHLFLR